MKTTKDYYQEFPGLIRSSTPLYIKSAGLQVLAYLAIYFTASPVNSNLILHPASQLFAEQDLPY